jgi:hypothetical protein
VFLGQPYALRWLLSYCDPRVHRGTVYQASGCTLARTNRAGLQTWRSALPELSPTQDAAVRERVTWSVRSQRYRAARQFTQLPLLVG